MHDIALVVARPDKVFVQSLLWGSYELTQGFVHIHLETHDSARGAHNAFFFFFYLRTSNLDSSFLLHQILLVPYGILDSSILAFPITLGFDPSFSKR